MDSCSACNHSLYDDVRGANNVANCVRYGEQPGNDFATITAKVALHNAGVTLGVDRVAWADGLGFSEEHIVQLTPIVEEVDRRLSAYEHNIDLETTDLSAWITEFNKLGFNDLATQVRALLQ